MMRVVCGKLMGTMAPRCVVFVDQWGRVWEWTGDGNPICTSDPTAKAAELDLSKLNLTDADRQLLADLGVGE